MTLGRKTWGAGRRAERLGRFPSPRPMFAAMSARRRAGVFVSGRTGWVRHPARLRARHLGAPSYQRVYRLEEARAVGAQLLRDKVAWKIRRPRAGRFLRLFVRSGNNSPPVLWKPWISRNFVEHRRLSASGLEAATSGATLRGRAWAETPRRGGMPHEIGAKSANLSTVTGAIRVSAIGSGAREPGRATARWAGRRDERRGASHPPGPRRRLSRLSAAVEMAETDTKSRGTFKKAPSPRAPAVRPERPLGSRLEYPIDGGRNRRHSPSATTIEA
jgi:hypothetical protein